MRNIALLSKVDREVLFSRTAEKMKMHPSIVEKDFWVCFMLDHLFHDCLYKDAFVFKGGTSLSKSYHVIERFSEDIDLILDWRKLIDNTNPWDERSKTKQDQYNKEINAIIVGNDGRRGYIYHTAVNPLYRKQGIAKTLVKAAMNALQKSGINKVALVVFDRNETGNDFWEKMGFTVRNDLIYRNKALVEMVRIDT